MNAPRVTPADIDANIASEHYFTAADGCSGRCNMNVSQDGWVEPLRLLTFCVLVLKNGYTVTGESACASPENFDAELSLKRARHNAINKAWPLMAYALRERLAAGEQSDAVASPTFTGTMKLVSGTETKLTTIVRAFVEKHRISCPETIHQTDYVIENAYGLIEDLCDAVGYYQHPDDSED